MKRTMRRSRTRRRLDLLVNFLGFLNNYVSDILNFFMDFSIISFLRFLTIIFVFFNNLFEFVNKKIEFVNNFFEFLETFVWISW